MKIISKNFIEQEIKNTGFSPEYVSIGANKHKFLNIKIFDLRALEANILKQTALSCDCDCAVHKNSIDCKVEKTDCVLSGSYSQLIEVSKKLRKQPLSLPKLSDEILNMILNSKYQAKSQIMGILNLTEDSFSDGGEFLDYTSACAQVDKMIQDGAKIIDIGAESTRPGALSVNSDIETEKITPVIKYIKEKHPNIQISIDTRNSKTALAALKLGADIINDVSGLRYDKDMAKTIAQFDTSVVIMHSRSNPSDMDNMCNYKNLVDEVYGELKTQCKLALESGIKAQNIIIDVGFGFAKNYEQNIELVQRIEEFKSMGYKMLVGVSRKRFLRQLANVDNPKDADDITAHTSAYFAQKGIDYIRVHNVKKNIEAIKFGTIFTQ